MTSKKTKFPRTMFQLTGSMNIREITLTGKAPNSWGGGFSDTYALDSKGKRHWLAGLFDTRDAALARAEVKMADQEARLAKATANVERRRAALQKAKGAA